MGRPKNKSGMRKATTANATTNTTSIGGETLVGTDTDVNLPPVQETSEQAKKSSGNEPNTNEVKTPLTDEKITKELYAAYDRIVAKDRFDSAPEIPVLYREALPYLPGFTPEMMKDAVLRLRRELKADTYQITDVRDPREPEFAIPTEHSHVYYVYLRPREGNEKE